MGYNKIPLALGFNDSTGNASGLIEFQLNLSDVGNVCSATPSDGQGLVWSGGGDGSWCPSTLPTGGGGGGAVDSVNGQTGDVSLYLSSLSGVDTSDLQEDHHIVYDGANWISQYPQNQYIIGTNPNAGTLVKGNIVYISDATTGGDPELSLARADSSTTMPSIGIVRENITTTNAGPVVTFGTALGLTFDVAPSAGDIGRTVYVSPLNAGQATLTKPSGATHLIQNIGVLVDNTPIKVKVTGVGRANDIPVNVDVVGSATIGTNEFTQTSAKLANVDANHILISTATSATSSIASATLFGDYVKSVNTQTPTAGNVSLTTDNIPQGSTNSYITTGEQTKLGHITVAAAVDINNIQPDDLNGTAVSANKIVSVDSAGTGFEAGVISALDDVTFQSGPTQGQSLVYDGDGPTGGWIASTIPTGGGAGFVGAGGVYFLAFASGDLVIADEQTSAIGWSDSGAAYLADPTNTIALDRAETPSASIIDVSAAGIYQIDCSIYGNNPTNRLAFELDLAIDRGSGFQVSSAHRSAQYVSRGNTGEDIFNGTAHLNTLLSLNVNDQIAIFAKALIGAGGTCTVKQDGTYIRIIRIA